MLLFLARPSRQKRPELTFDPLVRIKLVAQSLIARQLVRIKLVVHTDYFGELAF